MARAFGMMSWLLSTLGVALLLCAILAMPGVARAQTTGTNSQIADQCPTAFRNGVGIGCVTPNAACMHGSTPKTCVTIALSNGTGCTCFQ